MQRPHVSLRPGQPVGVPTPGVCNERSAAMQVGSELGAPHGFGGWWRECLSHLRWVSLLFQPVPQPVGLKSPCSLSTEHSSLQLNTPAGSCPPTPSLLNAAPSVS